MLSLFEGKLHGNPGWDDGGSAGGSEERGLHAGGYSQPEKNPPLLTGTGKGKFTQRYGNQTSYKILC